MVEVTIKADDGTTVTGYQFVEMEGNDEGLRTDCHGTTFADGKIWINNDQVEKILTGDNYEKTDKPQVGDVVVYRDEKGVVHSATVEEVDEKTGEVKKVRGLGGVETDTSDLPPGPGPGSAWKDPKAKKEYWHKKPKDEPKKDKSLSQ